MKIPLLMSDRAALKEIIGEDRGFIFKTEDEEDLANVAISCLNDQSECKRRANIAHEWLIANRTWGKMNAETPPKHYIQKSTVIEEYFPCHLSIGRVLHPFRAIEVHYNEDGWKRICEGRLKAWPSFGDITIEENIDWNIDPFSNKTWKLYFHSLNWTYSYLWGIDHKSILS